MEVAPSALKQLADIPRGVRERIAAHIEVWGFEPQPQGVKKLSGEEDLYRIRVGSHRVIYAIRDDRLIVLVLRIGHRKDIYRAGS
ncbi:MAG: type II toxin-antitoxin system RelE family toxin [Isosphaeraceae bacterium]